MKTLSRLLAPLATLVGLSVPAAFDEGCKAPVTPVVVQNDTNAVFSVEEVTCMVTGLIGPYLQGGTVAEVVSDIVQVCKIAPRLTQDVEDFVLAFVPPVDDAGPGTPRSDAYAAAWRVWAAARDARDSK